MDGAAPVERQQEAAQHADRVGDGRPEEAWSAACGLDGGQLPDLGQEAPVRVDHALGLRRRARGVGDHRGALRIDGKRAGDRRS